MSNCIGPALSGVILKEHVWESKAVSASMVCHSAGRTDSGLNRWAHFISSVLACVFHNSLPFHLVHCCHADHVSLHTFMMKSKLFSLYCKALYARSPFLSGLFSILHVHPIASFLSWAVIPAMFLPMAFSPLQLFIGKILATTNLLATSCTTSSTNLC